MLQLQNIVKEYEIGGQDRVAALRGITLAFRDSEFVSVLGPSGCGKTTLLNILGGLDQYTSGDLIIGGRSTKEYRDADWDTYRNHSIGFVFQSYNLIPHQSVLANVELALTLSGVSRAERRRRAVDALTRVGLGSQLHKRPNQMSGGQMQRVAIARALVNDPDILLADEPTGALDTATSVQIMDILREISKDKLILMVTHNPELAETYSTRIVRLLDGEVVGDTNPYDPAEAEKDAALLREKFAAQGTAGRKRKKHDDGSGKGKKSMSFFTALSLSFQNLLTKKTRTLLTSFAGSIGIIGIALILALSTGVQAFINDIQRDTLASYPIMIEEESTDITALLASMTGASIDVQTETAEKPERKDETVYSNPQIFQLFNSLFAAEKQENNLTAFREYLIEEMKKTDKNALSSKISSIQYTYALKTNPYILKADGTYQSCNVTDALENYAADNGSNGMYSLISRQVKMINLWTEFLPGKNGALLSDIYEEQYDIYGEWPQSAEDIVLILDGNGEISDFAFFALGLIPADEVTQMMTSAISGQKITIEERSLSYSDIIGTTFVMITDAECYTDTDGDGIFTNSRTDESMMKLLLAGATHVRISGIIRPKEDTTVSTSTAAFGYTAALTEKLITATQNSAVIRAQTAPENENRDVLSGKPFVITADIEPSDTVKAEKITAYFASLDDKGKTDLYTQMLAQPTDEQLQKDLAGIMAMCSDRAMMESMISSAYGMDAATVSAYLASYTDEQLQNMIREKMTESLTEQYKAAAQEQINEWMHTPSDAELNAFLGTILSRIGDTKLAKIGFIMNDWKQNVDMSEAAMAAYLNGLDDETLNETVRTVAARNASALYEKTVETSEETMYARVAARFDAAIAADTDPVALAAYYDAWMPSTVSGSTRSDVLDTLGCVDYGTPTAIYIYAENFEDKDAIAQAITAYNEIASEKDQIHYTDYVALLMNGVTDIIDGISYGLIIFVSISLVVSSIMIGIITYISVLERTKEIGILRAIGASKRDISSVFNAETLIVGFTAGMMGILISVLLCFPINLIIHKLSGINGINAFLPLNACIILVLISMGLTLIAGILPAGIAARRDPVVALRSE